MPFEQIHGGASCCWRYAKQRFHDASTAHGAMVGAWGGAGTSLPERGA